MYNLEWAHSATKTVSMMMKRMTTKRVRRKGSRYRASNSVMGESEAEVTDQIYLLQRKLLDPPGSTSDDGILAFQTFTPLRARHDGEKEDGITVGFWI